MRTTLTLEDDVAALLLRLRERRKASLKTVVNEALREGLVLPVDPEYRFFHGADAPGAAVTG